MTTKLFLEDLQEELLSHADPYRWYGLIVLLISTFIITLDGFTIYVAIPAIKLNLNASPAQMQLTLAAFQITNAALLIISGKIGDLYGRKKSFIIGLLGYAVAVSSCSIAGSANLIIMLNAVQGLATALISPQTVSMIRLSFTIKERTRAFGLYNSVMGAGAIIGLLAGGLILEKLGWRSVFLITPPVALLVLIGALVLLKESRSATRSRQLDIPGAILLTIGLSAMIGAVIIGREKGWPITAFVAFVLALAVLAVFFIYEKRLTTRKASPLVHYALLSDKSFVAGMMASMIYNTTQSSFYFVFILYLQFGLKLSPQIVGMMLVPMAVGFVSASMLAPRFSNKLGRRVVGLGVGLTIAGLVMLLLLLKSGSSKSTMLLVTMLQGVGLGITSTPIYSLVLSRVISNYAGVAAGMLSTAQQVGSALGIAFVGIVFFGVLGKMETTGALDYDAYSKAFSGAIFCHIGACAVVLMLLPFLPRHKVEEPIMQDDPRVSTSFLTR